MLNRLKRFGFEIRLRWMLPLLLLAILGAGVYYLYPRFSTNGAELQLVGVGPDGEFQPAVFVPAGWAQPGDPSVGGVARYPLLLGVRNVGSERARPERLVLHLPARYRLTLPGGEVLPRRIALSSPLVRYVFDIEPPVLVPGRLPDILPGLDTLWIEPLVPSHYCVVVADSVPEFLPAPVLEPELLGRVRIFYAFEGGTLDARETGTFEIRLDPDPLRRPETPAAPVFPVVINNKGLNLPELQLLRRAGARRSFCGEPEDPYELLTTLWEVPGGGRLFVLDFGGAPRKYLLDLDRDSIVEYELWDPDADGSFEIGRQARFPIPSILMPLPQPVRTDTLAAGSLAADSLAADSIAFDSAAVPTPGLRAAPVTPGPGQQTPVPTPVRPAPPQRPTPPRPAATDTVRPPAPRDTARPPLLGRPVGPPPMPPDTQPDLRRPAR